MVGAGPGVVAPDIAVGAEDGDGGAVAANRDGIVNGDGTEAAPGGGVRSDDSG